MTIVFIGSKVVHYHYVHYQYYHKDIGLQTSEMLMLFEILYRNIVFCYQRYQLKKNFLRKKFFSKQNYMGEHGCGTN